MPCDELGITSGRSVNTVYIGTKMGSTVVDPYFIYHTMLHSLHTNLIDTGIATEGIYPVDAASPPHTCYKGGYSVQWHHSNHPLCLDAIQLEFSPKCRGLEAADVNYSKDARSARELTGMCVAK